MWKIQTSYGVKKIEMNSYIVSRQKIVILYMMLILILFARVKISRLACRECRWISEWRKGFVYFLFTIKISIIWALKLNYQTPEMA
jgi:ribosomal protein L36